MVEVRRRRMGWMCVYVWAVEVERRVMGGVVGISRRGLGVGESMVAEEVPVVLEGMMGGIEELRMDYLNCLVLEDSRASLELQAV